MMPDGSHLITVFLQDMIYIRASDSKRPEHIHLLLSGTQESIEDQNWVQLPLCLSCL